MLKVYQNENGKTLISKEVLNLDGWKELIAGSTDAAQEKHVPVVTVKCKTVTVNVGEVTHPMSAEHNIAWIYLETTKGGQYKELTPDEAPEAVFKLGDEKAVAAYAYCNLHGLWKKEL